MKGNKEGREGGKEKRAGRGDDEKEGRNQRKEEWRK